MHRSVFAFVAVALLGAAAPSIEAQTGLAADTTTVEELTAYFAGQWSCAGEFASHKPIASDVRFESALDGAFVRYTHADRPPNGFEAQAMWGRGASPGEVLSVMQDNFGNTRVFRARGLQDSTLSFESAGLLADTTFHERFSYRIQGPNRYRMEYRASRDGITWRLGDWLECDRRT